MMIVYHVVLALMHARTGLRMKAMGNMRLIPICARIQRNVWQYAPWMRFIQFSKTIYQIGLLFRSNVFERGDLIDYRFLSQDFKLDFRGFKSHKNREESGFLKAGDREFGLSSQFI